MQDTRTWQTVLRAIETQLLTGVLNPGDRLPPERQLATDLGVGRSSVREALRVLEVLGLIRTATGSGPQAGAIIVSTPSGGMSTLLRLQVAAQGFRVSDIVNTRLMVESETALRLAHLCAQENPPKLAHSEQMLDAMDDSDLSRDEFLALDAQFHLDLAHAAGNDVITALMAGLRNSIENYVFEAATHLQSWPATVARLRAEHREILTAIRNGDTTAAPLLIRAHITGYYTETTAHLRPAATSANTNNPLNEERLP